MLLEATGDPWQNPGCGLSEREEIVHIEPYNYCIFHDNQTHNK